MNLQKGGGGGLTGSRAGLAVQDHADVVGLREVDDQVVLGTTWRFMGAYAWGFENPIITLLTRRVIIGYFK